MFALTEATIIVKSGENLGIFIQERAALNQGHKLFVLNRCFHNARLIWPKILFKKGAIRVKSNDDIEQHLASALH